jgi:hypothetical protein
VKQLYVSAFHNASEQYLKAVAAVGDGRASLANLTLDTGRPARAGEYSPADKAYVELLRRHEQDHFARMPKALADDMLEHFRNRDAALAFEDSNQEREKILAAVSELESAMPRAAQR